MPHILSVAAPALFLILLLSASAGYGGLVLRLDPELAGPTPWRRSLSIVWGLAAMAWILQWFSYFQRFTPLIATIVLLVGCVFLFFEPFSWSDLRTSWKGRAVSIGAVLSAVLLVWLPPAVHPYDDTRAYLIFPLKIISLGGIGWEPFSERRLFSLGAQYPLQALVFSWFPVRYASIIEPALGVVLLILLAAILSTPTRTLLCAGLLWIAALSGSRVLSNLAPAFLMIPPLFLIPLAPRDSRFILSKSDAAVLGVIAAFAVCLRPTAAPFAVLMLVWTIFRTSASMPLTNFGCSAAGAAVFALPFSLDLFPSGGTVYYPLLGRGFHLSAHAATASISALTSVSGHLMNLARTPLTDPFFWLLGALALISRRFEVAAAALFTYGVIIVQSSGTNPSRYAAPVLLAAALYLIITIERSGSFHFTVPRPLLGVMAVVTLFLVYRFGPAGLAFAQNKLETRYASIYPPASEIAAYRELQAAIPVGTTVLVTLNRADLLDFRRNRILLNDEPLMTSPPPGWPTQPSGKLFAAYLRQQGIDYVAVSTNTDSPVTTASDLTNPLHKWIDILHRFAALFDRALADEPFRSAIVYRTHAFRVYRVP